MHKTETVAAEEIIEIQVPVKLYFSQGVNGLIKGAPVEYKGLRLGTVTDIGVEPNKEETDLLTYAIVGIGTGANRIPVERNVALLHAGL